MGAMKLQNQLLRQKSQQSLALLFLIHGMGQDTGCGVTPQVAPFGWPCPTCSIANDYISRP
jgi:hypothetical protein